jgi:hypothetical protein
VATAGAVAAFELSLELWPSFGFASGLVVFSAEASDAEVVIEDALEDLESVV